MKKILAAMMIIAAFTGISHADILYTTSEGSLGVIPVGNGTSTSIDVPVLTYSHLGSDAIAGSYSVGKDHYVMVVDRRPDDVSGDRALIFSSSNLESPVNSADLEGVNSTKTFGGSYNGRSLFFASGATPTIAEFSTSDMSFQNLYTYVDSNDKSYLPEILDMAVGIANIYALFSRSDGMVELIAFDGQLKDDVSEIVKGTLSEDASMIAAMSLGRFALASSEGIKVIRRNVFTTIWSSDKTVKAMCRDDEDGLYFIAHNESDDEDELYHYAEDKIYDIPFDSFEGDSDCKLVRDIDNHVLAAKVGGSVYLYSITDDLLIDEFGASELGGTLVSISAGRTDADDGKSSSSNCNVSCAGAVLAVILGFALRRR